ncbi:MAG: cytochrome c3 family protein [Planctomycetota bacterium]|jgi:nitrate/TMAO reductase-like tetraheme cytochrome c subunit
MKIFPTKAVKKIFQTFRKHSCVFLAGFVFALLCFIGINAAMEPVSKSKFCGTLCHEMNTAYRSWELSAHGANNNGVQIECIDCHLPPKENFFSHITAKAYEGTKDVYKHYFGGQYNVEKTRKKVLENIDSSRCLKCHKNLLAKPGSSGAAMAHQEMLNPTAALKLECVHCHEHLHERERKIFASP